MNHAPYVEVVPEGSVLSVAVPWDRARSLCRQLRLRGYPAGLHSDFRNRRAELLLPAAMGPDSVRRLIGEVF